MRRQKLSGPSVKTIQTLKPNAFVLENVVALTRRESRQVVEDAFDTLKDYLVLQVQALERHQNIPMTFFALGCRMSA